MKTVLYIAIFEKNAINQDGVIKKIKSQIKAFEENEYNVSYIFKDEKKIYLSHNQCIIPLLDTSFSFFKDSLKTYNKIRKIISKQELDFDIAFIRDQGPNICLLFMLRKMKKRGIISYMELPTYPTKGERRRGIKNKVRNLHDDIMNSLLHHYLNYIVTYSLNDTIYNIPCINIVNGIDLNKISLINKSEKKDDSINFTTVSTCCYWHGIDRMLVSLENYILSNDCSNVFFNIVGDGPELKSLIKRVEESNVLGDYVYFHGFKTSDDLDKIYNDTDIAVGSLGRHRSNIHTIRPLKNVEYAAKGLPMIYSESDPGFNDYEFVYRIPSNDEPFEIGEIIKWYKSISVEKEQIRKSVNQFTWKKQIHKIVTTVK